MPCVFYNIILPRKEISMQLLSPVIALCILMPYTLLNDARAQTPPSNAQMKKLMKMGTEMQKKLEKDSTYETVLGKDEMLPNQVKTFPKQNKALWGLVHAGPMTTLEIKNYLNKLHLTLLPKIPLTARQNAEKIAIQLKKNSGDIGNTAVVTWYSGAKNEGLILALNACIENPEDKLMLNNFAALLNLDSKEKLALPILKTVVASESNNAMILNNLGQTYAGLGELDSAMHYLGACIQIEPNHPEANNTAGQIEKERENTTSAGKKFESSLKGAYNEGAAEALQVTSPDSKLTDILKRRIKLPYFNEGRYQLPRFCQNVFEAAEVRQEVSDFREFINNQVSKYSSLQSIEVRKGTTEFLELQQRVMNNPTAYDIGVLTVPFVNAGIIFTRLTYEHLDMLKSLAKTLETNEIAIEQLLEDYNNKLKNADCDQANQLGNQVLIEVAGMQQDEEDRRLRILREMFEDEAYFQPLCRPNAHLAMASFYEAVCSFLNSLSSILTERIFLDGCHENQAAPKPITDSIIQFKCPIDIEVGIGIAKIKLNCEKFQFTVGEFGRFKYEKNFNSKQSTMSIGGGLGLDFAKNSSLGGGIKGEALFFVSFDANNNVSDLGVSFDFKSYVKADLEFNLKINSEGGVGCKLGINSGWTFKSE